MIFIPEINPVAGNWSLFCENNCSPGCSSDHNKQVDDHAAHVDKK